MFRHALMTGVLLLAMGCDAARAGDKAAVVEFNGNTHELTIHGSCRAADNGAYNFWAVTPDEEEPEVARKGAPRLQAISSGQWSRLTFYLDGTEPAAVVFGRGEDRLELTDGSLKYSGSVTEGQDEISVSVDC